MIERVGFVGLGAMGMAMARNLLKAGFQVACYDVQQEPMDLLKRDGGAPSDSPAHAAANAEVVITMLPHDDAVRSAVLGPQGVAEGLGQGCALIEMSTISVGLVKEIEQVLSGRGAEVLDAPVGGTPDIAAKGELTILVGGSEATLERCLPVLSAMGAHIMPVGVVGNGKLGKMANNMLVTVGLLSVMEVLAWAQKAGADIDLLAQALQILPASSTMMNFHLARMSSIPEQYRQQRIWFHKDIHLLLEEAEAMRAALPMTAQAKSILSAARNLEGGEETMGSLLAYYERTM